MENGKSYYTPTGVRNTRRFAAVRNYTLKKDYDDGLWLDCDNKTNLNESSTEKFMKEHGIEREIQPGVGFSEKEQKWYGWSHRGSRGFGIGGVAVECYPSGTKKGNKCKTLEDCKKAAIAFSKSVS